MNRAGRTALVAAAGALLVGCAQPAGAPPLTTETSGRSSQAVSAPRYTKPGSIQPRWRPRQGTTWQWQLSGPLALDVSAGVYDLDLETTPASAVQALHARGRRAICYLSAGTFEPGRTDSGRFPTGVLGKPLADWPEERWLDIRQTHVLLPLMADRIARCKAKGFDAVEPDNVDAYTNDSGFPLTAADQLRYNVAIASLAHRAGLSVGLKNDVEQIPQLATVFDFAVNEQCVEYAECGAYAPFLRLRKAVLHVEYRPGLAFCDAVPAGFSSMQKNLSLDAARWPCRAAGR